MSKHAVQLERLRQIVASFPDLKVTVVGDFVADEFVFGEISRVSREAPVLILKHRESRVVPGGGANAVNNLASLGVKVFPVGVLGDDEAGSLLLKHFREKNVVTGGILRDRTYSTPTKTRILAGMAHTSRQQVVRIDREPKQEPDVRAKVVAAARKYLRSSNALLVSDYGYGAATPEIVRSIRQGRAMHKIPIVLDSRHRLLQYSGITAATPNEPEVEEALETKIGHDWARICWAGKKIISKMGLQSLIITRGRDGMVAFDGNNKPADIPIVGTDEVADVTGAGDTVIATFTAALAAGASTLEASHLANYAGGIVVMKRGTATVSSKELIQAII